VNCDSALLRAAPPPGRYATDLPRLAGEVTGDLKS